MTYTKVIDRDHRNIIVARTSKRVTTYNRERDAMVERNVWKDEKGREYVQFKGMFWSVFDRSQFGYDCGMGRSFRIVKA